MNYKNGIAENQKKKDNRQKAVDSTSQNVTSDPSFSARHGSASTNKDYTREAVSQNELDSGEKKVTSNGRAATKSKALSTPEERLAYDRKIEKGTNQEKYGPLGAFATSVKHGAEDAIKTTTKQDVGSRRAAAKKEKALAEENGKKETASHTIAKTQPAAQPTEAVGEEAKAEAQPKESDYDEKYGKKYGISKETWDSMNDVEKSRIYDREAYKGRGLDVVKHILGSLGNGMAAFSGAQQNYDNKAFMDNTKKNVGARTAEESRQRQQESIKKMEDLGINKELAKYTSDLSTDSAKVLANLSAANQKDLAQFMSTLNIDEQKEVNNYLTTLSLEEAMKIGFTKNPIGALQGVIGAVAGVPSDSACKAFATRRLFK